MKPRRIGRRLSFKLCIASGLLVLVFAMPLWSMRDGVMPLLIGELRELKTQRLFFARALAVLKDNQPVISALSAKPANVESLILSFIEMTKLQATNLDAEILLLTVTDSNESQAVSRAQAQVQVQSELQPAHGDESLHFLRIEFTGVLQRATDLLLLFDGVRDIADWRPMEVRACSIVRQVELAGLHAVCTIDVYYFPELAV